MTSLQTSIKQVDTENGYYVTLTAGGLLRKVYGYNASNNQLSTVNWCNAGAPSTQLASAGAVLRDMGKTVVSSLRTFRKVQLLLPASPSTFGVQGTQGTGYNEDYCVGYIELGFEGNGTPAPVAKFGR